MVWLWLVIGGTLAVLLLAAWWIDRGVRRRGSQVHHHSDVWYQVREARRDAEARSPYGKDDSWTSWSRRNRR